MPNPDIPAIEAAIEKATAGPWWRTDPPWGCGTTVHAGPSDDPHTAKCYIADGQMMLDTVTALEVEQNMHLIAHAPEWLAALVAEVKRLREAVEDLEHRRDADCIEQIKRLPLEWQGKWRDLKGERDTSTRWLRWHLQGTPNWEEKMRARGCTDAQVAEVRGLVETFNTKGDSDGCIDER